MFEQNVLALSAARELVGTVEISIHVL